MTKKQNREFVFKINAYSVGTIPMNRLAEYLQDLSTIMGEYKNVHFVKLRSGSVGAAIRVDHEAEPKVRERIRRSRTPDGPDDARNAIRSINMRLAADNASGSLQDPSKRNIIQFPGRKKFAQPMIGPIRQPGTLDGIPIRIGGRGALVPVHLDRFGHEVYICGARRELAARIAKHMFESAIRVEGSGAWTRGADGEWQMDSFTIQEFRPLADTRLMDTIVQLREVELDVEPKENILDTMSEIRSGS